MTWTSFFFALSAVCATVVASITTFVTANKDAPVDVQEQVGEGNVIFRVLQTKAADSPPVVYLKMWLAVEVPLLLVIVLIMFANIGQDAG